MSYHEFLHTFLAVYRLGSQVKAAQSLGITQPAVSQHLKALEHHLGKPLFHREGRRLKPTVVAQQLALNINEPINKLEAVLKQTRANHTPLQGDIIMGGLTPFFAKVIIPTLPTLFKHDIQLRFEYEYENITPRLLNNELDIAQFSHHIVHPQIELEKLFQQQFVLIGHKKFLKQIARKQLLQNEISCLKDIPWIVYDGSLLFINEYFNTVFNQPFNGKITLIVQDLWAMLEAAVAGIGITILPSFFFQDQLDNKKINILFDTQKAPSHHFYLGWKKGALHNPKIQLVREILLEVCNID